MRDLFMTGRNSRVTSIDEGVIYNDELGQGWEYTVIDDVDRRSALEDIDRAKAKAKQEEGSK